MKTMTFYTFRLLLFFCFLLTIFCVQAQQNNRIDSLEHQLTEFAIENRSLNDRVDVSMAGSVQDIVTTLAESTDLNVSIDPNIDLKVAANFSEAKAKDILLFLCDSYKLDLRFNGGIIRVISYNKPKEKEKIKEIGVEYNSYNNSLTLDLKNDTLEAVLKKIVQLTNKNIIPSNTVRNQLVTGYSQKVKLEEALQQLALSNDLVITETEKGFFMVNALKTSEQGTDNRLSKKRKELPGKKIPAGLQLKTRDSSGVKLFTITASEISRKEIIEQLAYEAGVDYFIYDFPGQRPSGTTAKTTGGKASPFNDKINLSIHQIAFESLLDLILQETNSTFRVEQGIYLIGERADEPLRASKVVQIQHRPVDDILELIPADITTGVTIKPLQKLNSMILSGSRPNIEEIEAVILSMDKSVPNVTIELIIVDVQKSVGVTTGIKAGINGDVKSGGTIFPALDFTFSSASVNDLLQWISGTGIINLGNVVPDFYISLQAVEDAGIVKVNSRPKLSTINAQEATFKIGETQYYVQEDTRVDAGVSPVVSQSRRFESVSADFTINIKPIISGDEFVTLDIDVSQSDFTPAVIQGAPPGQVSRAFTSTIRVKDQEMIVLGGLDTKRKENTGRGVPVLSRIPVLNWFFSSKTKRAEKSQLLIFVRPNIIY